MLEPAIDAIPVTALPPVRPWAPSTRRDAALISRQEALFTEVFEAGRKGREAVSPSEQWQGVAAGLKEKTERTLAERSELPYDVVHELVTSWAGSATNRVSLAIQEAVAMEFGTGFNGYVDDLRDERAAPLPPANFRRQITERYAWEDLLPVATSAVLAMYSLTQEYLAARGVSEMAVFRGTSYGSHPSFPAALVEAARRIWHFCTPAFLATLAPEGTSLEQWDKPGHAPPLEALTRTARAWLGTDGEVMEARDKEGVLVDLATRYGDYVVSQQGVCAVGDYERALGVKLTPAPANSAAYLPPTAKETEGARELMGIVGDLRPVLAEAPKPWGEAVHFHANPVSSFSVNPLIAARFSVSHGAVLSGFVPAARILFLPMTGFGCLREGEVGVIGGGMEMVATPCWRNEESWEMMTGYGKGVGRKSALPGG